MEKQLFSLVVVVTGVLLNLILLFISKSYPRRDSSVSCQPSHAQLTNIVTYEKVLSLELSLEEREFEILKLKEQIAELQNRLSSAHRIQQRTEKVLTSTKNELSLCVSSHEYSQNDDNKPSPVIRTVNTHLRAVPDYSSLSLKPSRYDWSSSTGYIEENVKKNPPQKSDMNTDVTIIIFCGNCTMQTKYPSESIDILNRWYPLVKIYLEGPNDPNASSKLITNLAEVKTRYVLVIDASVEFTHNSNLPRMKSLLQMNQIHVVSPMTEDASTNQLYSHCYDYSYHSHTLHIRRGYSDILSGNSVLCERGGPYFMTSTETLKQMWPNQPLPLTLSIEAFYLELRSFEMKVGFCPGSILRANVIRAYNPSREVDVEACNVFDQPLHLLDEMSKKAFAAKYHVSRIVYPDGLEVYLPEPVYELHDLAYTYHSANFYQAQRTMLFTASKIMEQHSLPLFLMDDELMAAVLLGVPFPWSDNIQMHILQIYVCCFLNLYMLCKIRKQTSDSETIKRITRYGLDILRNEEDSEVCFGINLVDKLAGDDIPVGVVVRHLEASDVVDYLLPLKKMQFLGTDVLVPNNPIAFLEKVYEDKFDVLKETDLFKETNSKMDQWKKCEQEVDPDYALMCINSPFEYSNDVDSMITNPAFYY